MSCDSVQNWWREGRTLPMPDVVREHIESCSACASQNAAFDEELEWFGQEAPIQNAAKMRAAILSSRGQKPRRDHRRTFALAMAAALSFGIFYWAFAQVEQTTVTPLSEATEFEEVKGGVRLSDGLAHFAVTLTDDEPNYTVNVGESRVQVLGTKFTVHAKHGQLVGVDVYEGIVLVVHEGKSHKILEGGHFEPSTQKIVQVPDVKEAASLAEKISSSATKSTNQKLAKASAKKAAIKRVQTPTVTLAKPEAKSPAFARAWKAIQSKDYEKALSAMNEVDDKSLGQLAPTIGYWRVLSLVKLGRLEEAKKANATLQSRYAKSDAAKSANALVNAP